MSADIDEAAARWHLAQARDDMDWAGFTEWLETDPRHREAYDAIALLDARIDDARPALAQLLSDEPQVPKHRFLPRLAGWTAVAAVLIAAIVIGITRLPFGAKDESLVYRAPLGQPREIRLADGSTATLAPGSTLRVAGTRDAAMTLDGNAYFDVRHDAAHPLTVRAGGFEIRDIGTRFDVSASGGLVRVAVAEGRVAVRSPAMAGEVEIAAGKALTVSEKGGTAEVRPVRAPAIGAWRTGPLVYDDVPLAMVAADIARSTGHPVTIDPSVARRRFSGVIAPGDRAAMVGSLSALTGLKTRTDGDALRLGDGAGR